MTSLEMLDECGRFPFVEEVRQFPKHFLRKVPNLLVRPFPGFGQREDRGELSCSQASGAGAVPVCTIGMVRSVPVAITVSGRRPTKVKMQSDSKQRGAFLEAVRCSRLQIISKGNDRIVFLGSRDPGFPKLTLRDSLCRQSPENDNFVVIDPVILDVKDPFCFEAFVEPLDYSATFDVIEHVSIRALSSLDLFGHKRLFEDFSIHNVLLSVLFWKNFTT
jgi:hypothetical protein